MNFTGVSVCAVAVAADPVVFPPEAAGLLSFLGAFRTGGVAAASVLLVVDAAAVVFFTGVAFDDAVEVIFVGALALGFFVDDCAVLEILSTFAVDCV